MSSRGAKRKRSKTCEWKEEETSAPPPKKPKKAKRLAKGPAKAKLELALISMHHADDAPGPHCDLCGEGLAHFRCSVEGCQRTFHRKCNEEMMVNDKGCMGCGAMLCAVHDQNDGGAARLDMSGNEWLCQACYWYVVMQNPTSPPLLKHDTTPPPRPSWM
jgi:hypothetical protein